MMLRARLWVVCLFLASAPGLVHAWDPATTHAGLTERAVAVSTLHTALARDLDRALGLFEPLRLDFATLATLDRGLALDLKARLDALDPAGGYRPGADGVATASAWLRAGAVLAKTPPERGRNHFLDPTSRTGLDDNRGLSGALHAARLTLDDGATLRDTATGRTFDLEGMSALEWIHSPRNDLGLLAFWDAWVLATSAAHAAEREAALVRALLALGGVLAVLEDMGQPAHVRNDFRAEFLSHETGSAFNRFVAERYGAVALPAPAKTVVRPTIDSFFVADDGAGLAQITQRRFFSAGTRPRDLDIDPVQSGADVALAANRSLGFAEPSIPSLNIKQDGRIRHVVRDGVRILAYDCARNRVHFFFDDAVRTDMARRWLPQVEAYAAGLVNHLLRASVRIKAAGNSADISIAGVETDVLSRQSLHVFVEDVAGKRRQLTSIVIAADSSPMTVALPGDARKVAAYVRHEGADGFVAAAEARVP